MGYSVRLRVFRFDPGKDPSPHYDTFSVETWERMTVLEALFEVLEKQDNSLAFRFACRGAVCGSCAMFISGDYRLACQTQLAQIKQREIWVAPLPHLPIIKDLVVDMEPFYQKLEAIMPYLKGEATPPEREYLQTPQQRKALDEVTDCVWCAACHSACPITWTDKDYLGPAALTTAFRFVADSRDQAKAERLRLIDRENGIWRCHTIFNCVEACPKKINPTRAIERLRLKALAQRMKRP